MNLTTPVFNDAENSTSQVVYSSNTAVTAGAISGVLMAAFVITLLICKYKPSYFTCLQQVLQNERRASNMRLTNEDEGEHIHNIMESDIHIEDEYFFDEVFERSAFTDEMTNDSITNLFTISDDADDTVQPHVLHNHLEDHI